MKTFVAASSNYMSCLDGSYGNWLSTQAWTIKFGVTPTSNVTGYVIAREDVTTLIGWGVFLRAGASGPTVAMEIQNSGITKRLAARSTAELTVGSPAWCSVTYDGTRAVSGVTFRIAGANSVPVSIANTLDASSTVATGPVEVGRSRGGSGTVYLNASLQRLMLYKSVLSTADQDTQSIVSGSDLWLELSDVGATIQPDWSENRRTFSISFKQVYAAGNWADIAPSLGTSGVRTLMGPLKRNASNPTMSNLGGSVADQIGPGDHAKLIKGVYRAFQNNDTGAKSLDVGNQGGPVDWDAPMVLGTSATGDAWTFAHQGDPANAEISVNTVGGDATFKAAAHGETDFRTRLRDRNDGSFRFYGHCGNNTGPRQIYQLKAPVGCDSWIGSNYAVYPAGTGRPILTVGGAGSDDEFFCVDAHVVQANPSLWVMHYWGMTPGGVASVLLATSTDGDSWTKQGRAIAFGASGDWDGGSIYPLGIDYDAASGYWYGWYGGGIAAGGNDGIGMWYTKDLTSIPYSKGLFNPVACKGDNASGATNYERLIATSGQMYRDGNRRRIVVRFDNGVSGTSGFRGRGEFYYDLIVTNKSGFLAA